MASLKDLAKYIYGNQKKGFSDAEIYQLLEQSGWDIEDINGAFKKAHLLKNIDTILSAPFSYLKKWATSFFSNLAHAPSDIVRLILSIAQNTGTKTFESIVFIFGALTRLLKHIFIDALKSTLANLSQSKILKIKNAAAIEELSKYIEKNFREGSLEGDIFVALLKIGWDKKIIDKAFSRAHSRILKGNVVAFVKFLLLSPFFAGKRIISLVLSALKKIFYDLPLTILIGTKKATVFIFANISDNLVSLYGFFTNPFKKKPASFRSQYKTVAPRLTINQRVKLFLASTLNSLKLWLSRTFKKTSEIKKPAQQIVIIPRVSSFSMFLKSLKYFFVSYPQAIRRIRQRSLFNVSRSIKNAPSRAFLILARIGEFFRYDLIFLLKKISIYPKRFLSLVLNRFKSVSIIGLIKLPIRLLILLAKLPLWAIFSIFKLIKEINVSIFVLPFEIIEFVLLKLWQALKKSFGLLIAPFAPRLKPIVLSIKRIFVPASKELDFVPQNLSEIPIGEVADTMKPADILRIAARMFKTRRLRTFLTILGIGIGIGAILFLVSLGYGLQRILIEEIATSDALLSLDVSTRDEILIPLDKASIDKFTAMPEVSYVSPLVAVPGQISLGNTTANTMVNGILPNYFKLGGIVTDEGELFQEGEQTKILISLPIVKLLNPNVISEEIPDVQIKEMLGQKVSITLLLPTQTDTGLEEVRTIEFQTEFEISGVVEDAMESLIYFPLSRLEEVGITKYQSAKVRVADNNSLEPVRTKAVEMGFIVAALSDTIEQANKVFQVLQIILALFGIVALSVSAIGMFNTMTIALLERTQEIGIMKSLGASNKNVWELFLAESIIMGFLGGVGGVTIGYLSSEGFNLLIRILAGALGGRKVQLFERPWWFIVTILVFSTVVGLFTGLWPARRAARINILQALRYK